MRAPAIICLMILGLAPLHAQQRLQLMSHPAVSPDGKRLAFDYNGDIWVASSDGGVARPISNHPARDSHPVFSPDGQSIAFQSDRNGTACIHLMPVSGGAARQVTFHTSGSIPLQFTADGTAILVEVIRDHAWKHANRLALIDIRQRNAEEIIFDAEASTGQISPNGQNVLYVREGTQWWRKGYHGSQAWQLWQFDRATRNHVRLLENPPPAPGKPVVHPEARGIQAPLWKPDGKGFYYVGGQSGNFNLWEHDLTTSRGRMLTNFTDDSVVQPAISADGSTIVFRHLFDLYAFKPASGQPPKRLELVSASEVTRDAKERRVLTTATHVAFSNDGLEVAFIAGGDVWVMDTELREPIQVTNTPEEERTVTFTPSGDALLFVSDTGGRTEMVRATRADPAAYWWRNSKFPTSVITKDGQPKSGIRTSPDGSRVAFVRGRGELVSIKPDGTDEKIHLKSHSAPDFDWSPDGAFIVYAAQDDDFNSDIWIVPTDGAKPAVNISRHPDNDTDPAWSPDGKIIAFVGRRTGTEVDIHYVYLRSTDEETGSRDRSLEKALEKMKSRRTAKPTEAAKPAAEAKPVAKQPVLIDFDGIAERIRTINIADSEEQGLTWSPDSKKLAFTSGSEGKRATYTVEFPDNLKPTSINTGTGTQARWLKNGSIVWLATGIPASFVPGGAAPTGTATAPAATRSTRTATVAPPTPSGSSETAGTSYRFNALQEVDVAAKNAAVFDLCWRTMRDNWYDERLNNRDWNAVREKYRAASAQAADQDTLAIVVNLMLGELNGSHLGFSITAGGASPRRGPAAPVESGPSTRWTLVTQHPGFRLDPAHRGDAWKIRDLIKGSPAARVRHGLKAGDLIIAVGGVLVRHTTDPSAVFTLPPGAEITVYVRDAAGKERMETFPPISYLQARQSLYGMWMDENRKEVEKQSQGNLGYLHIQAMDMPSFHKFEEMLHFAGAGKKGLVIDVRENGGGSTADLLLTALTQPVHAYTVPRGGSVPGYPQDRKIFASWTKPVVVLCNQNSFSNAEIFSHAIKTLKRGRLVGVPTAGGVISTGGTSIMDVGFLRLPFRGWYLAGNGEDLELNGAIPDVVIWPKPGDTADRQLEKAVQMLSEDVKIFEARPLPAPRKASQR